MPASFRVSESTLDSSLMLCVIRLGLREIVGVCSRATWGSRRKGQVIVPLPQRLPTIAAARPVNGAARPVNWPAARRVRSLCGRGRNTRFQAFAAARQLTDLQYHRSAYRPSFRLSLT
jgi:hypothetical protein